MKHIPSSEPGLEPGSVKLNNDGENDVATTTTPKKQNGAKTVQNGPKTVQKRPKMPWKRSETV